MWHMHIDRTVQQRTSSHLQLRPLLCPTLTTMMMASGFVTNSWSSWVGGDSECGITCSKRKEHCAATAKMLQQYLLALHVPSALCTHADCHQHVSNAVAGHILMFVSSRTLPTGCNTLSSSPCCTFNMHVDVHLHKHRPQASATSATSICTSIGHKCQSAHPAPCSAQH